MLLLTHYTFYLSFWSYKAVNFQKQCISDIIYHGKAVLRGLSDSLNKDKANIVKESILMNIQEILITIQEKSDLIFKMCVCLNVCI